MNIFYKWVILAALLFSAIASYSYGFSHGVFIFVGLGMILELAFWLGLFGKKQYSSKTIN